MRAVDVVERRLLKQSPNRSVRLEIDSSGAATVVKRFESRGLAAATLDRARAARELRLLEELHARGVAAPKPLGLARVDRGWEVRMEWIADAKPLSELLARREHDRSASAPLARALGELLAALHTAGVDHPDLHAGNVLVGQGAAVWAIDFHKARRLSRTPAKTALRDLVSLAAGVREATSAAFRARFLAAWTRAAPRELVEELCSRGRGARTAFAAELERRARERRFQVVRKRRARWLRESSSCASIAEPFEGFARSGVDPRAEFDARRQLVLCDLDERAAKHVWCSAARLEEHGLPCARPQTLSLRPTVRVALEPPGAGRACTGAQDLRGARSLYELGKLCATLADRRVRVRAGQGPALWRCDDGRLALACIRGLDADPRGGDGIDLVRTLALAGLALEDLTPRERAAYAAGIVAGAGLGTRESARLRAQLRHV